MKDIQGCWQVQQAFTTHSFIALGLWVSSFFHCSTEVLWGDHYDDIFSLYPSIPTVHPSSSCSLPPEANPEDLLYLLPHLLSNVQLVWPIGSLGWRVKE